MQWWEREWRILPALCSKLWELWDLLLGVGDVLGDVANLEEAPDALDLGRTIGKFVSELSRPGNLATMAVMSGPFWNTCTSDFGLALAGSDVMLIFVTFFFVLFTVMQLSLLLTGWSWKVLLYSYYY